MGGTPRPALLVVIVATAAIIFAADMVKGPLYEILLDLYAPFAMLIFLGLSVAVIHLRRREPDLPRPWKMPLYPLPALLSILFNGVLLVLFLVSAPKTAVFSILFLLAGGLIYRFGRGRWRTA